MPHKPIPFKVRDFREKGFWMADDVYLNSYAKYLDPFATAVYFSLCRHANKTQSCFPPQQLIAEEHKIGKRTVVTKLQLLEDWNIIKRKKVRTKGGKWLNNTYYLIDKSEWKPLPSAGDAHGDSQVQENTNQVQEMHYKGTHTKETNTNIQQAVGVRYKKKSGGAQYEWQDRAVTLWKGIGLKGDPSPSFFKLVKKAFKVGKEGLLTATYASTADADAKDPERLFYWTFNKKMKGGT